MSSYHGYGMKLTDGDTLAYRQDEANLSQEGIMASFNIYNVSQLIANSLYAIELSVSSEMGRYGTPQKGLNATYRVSIKASDTINASAQLQFNHEINIGVSDPVWTGTLPGGIVDTSWNIKGQLNGDSIHVELYILNSPFELGIPVGSPLVDMTTIGMVVIRSCDTHNSSRDGNQVPPGCQKFIRQLRYKYTFADRGIDLH